jgi:DNA-binding NarL/FixJ family response regulator
MLHHALIISSNREYVQAMRHGLLALGDGLTRIDVELDPLRATQLAPQQYELILLDAVIEAIDGLQLLVLIKPQAPACKFVIVSDKTVEAVRAAAYQNGADFFLERPTTPESLDLALRAIRGLIKPSKTVGLAQEEESSTVVAIADIVQMRCLSGDSVLLTIRSQFQSGDIFIYRGEVFHAQYPGKSGEAAFHDILHWDRGLARIKAIKLSHTPPRTIETGYRLLLETARKPPETEPIPCPPDAGHGIIALTIDKPSETAALSVIKEAPPRDNDLVPSFFDTKKKSPAGDIALPRLNSHWMVSLTGDLMEGSQVADPERCAFISSFIFRKMADVAVALELEYFDAFTLLGPHLQQVLVADNIGVRHAVFETAWTTEEMRVQFVKWSREQSF